MKRKHVSLLLALTLILSTLVLASCSEAEPLPEGVSELPDLDASELAESLADESGVIQWPADMLPDDLPMPEYDEIYSVKREDNEISIILIATYDLNEVLRITQSVDPSQLNQYYDKLMPPMVKYITALEENGYLHYGASGTDRNYCYCTLEGWRIQLCDTREGIHPELDDAKKKSPTNYTYMLSLRPIEVFDSFSWTYPGKDESIGLPDLGTVDDWPAEYLPENIHDLREKVDLVSVEVLESGVRIAYEANQVNSNSFTTEIYNEGYYFCGDRFIDKEGNTVIGLGGNYYTVDGNEVYCVIYQFCKYNEKIKKQ